MSNKEAKLKQITIDDKSQHAIQKSFSEIAKRLINEHVIVANGREYRTIDLEFYYYNKECHRDEYSHAHKPNSRSR